MLGVIGHGALDPRLQVPARHVLRAGDVARLELVRLTDVDQRGAVRCLTPRLTGIDLVDLLPDLLDDVRAGGAHY